jgi:hypothetical protein
MSSGNSKIHASSAWPGVARSIGEGESRRADQARPAGLIAVAGKQAATISRNVARELREHPFETAAILAAAAAAIAIAMTPRSEQASEAR